MFLYDIRQPYGDTCIFTAWVINELTDEFRECFGDVRQVIQFREVTYRYRSHVRYHDQRDQ